MEDPALLAGPHLSVVSAEPDGELQRIARTIGPCVTVNGPRALEAALTRLAAAADRAPGAADRSADRTAARTAARTATRTLDLIGHTRTVASLLSLGDWRIDAADPATVAVFRELAERAVLPRLGIHALRLLGCRSAGSERGRDTICRLAALLGVEVAGTRELLHAGNYGPGGFRDEWSFLLVRASELRRPPDEPRGPPGPRTLELAALPAIALAAHAAPCPRRIASEHATRRILALVRRAAGACMPGPPPPPAIELALPLRGGHHLAHVVLDGGFLRLYPDGMARPGVLFPVGDPDALHRIIAGLPAAPDPR
ncbi:MAG TPA: hypothetical protein VHW23_31330 [Kofleriaceae bacterium]|nr:hypothetical protein [Kofleriaceae bacterium]